MRRRAWRPPFIAPKIDANGGAGGPSATPVVYCRYKRDEFLTNSRRPSNEESTSSAGNRKSGDGARRRAYSPMADELLANFIYSKRARVILSGVESGIEAEFRPADDLDAGRDVVPLRCGG